MTRAERKARREARRQRKLKREKKRAVAAVLDKQRPNVIPSYVNEDPLVVYDRHRNETNAIFDYFRQPFTQRRAGFLCCGGPSYRLLDAEKLNQPGVATIGINNTARDLNCDVAIFSDPAEKFHHGIMLDHKIMKLLPLPRLSDRIRIKHEDRWMKTPVRVSDCPLGIRPEAFCLNKVRLLGWRAPGTVTSTLFVTDYEYTVSNNPDHATKVCP